ncbi:hypothetical protein [Macrococcoides caseolyticum]|uniref:hypothetical protein n=1 Tax=Macrococcoides caseolyticum TaxID=69966 RepID=UPI0012FF4CED|nr:hypothetical protein [Macrococcus caseolyticus]
MKFKNAANYYKREEHLETNRDGIGSHLNLKKKLNLYKQNIETFGKTHFDYE